MPEVMDASDGIPYEFSVKFELTRSGRSLGSDTWKYPGDSCHTLAESPFASATEYDICGHREHRRRICVFRRRAARSNCERRHRLCSGTAGTACLEIQEAFRSTHSKLQLL